MSTTLETIDDELSPPFYTHLAISFHLDHSPNLINSLPSTIILPSIYKMYFHAFTLYFMPDERQEAVTSYVQQPPVLVYAERVDTRNLFRVPPFHTDKVISSARHLSRSAGPSWRHRRGLFPRCILPWYDSSSCPRPGLRSARHKY